MDVSHSVGAFTAQGACSVESQETAGYACFRTRDGALYLGRPVYKNEAPAVGWASARVRLSYDRLLFYDTSLGFRLGYAFAGEGPTLPGGTRFIPYSAEVVVRHWFGTDPFARPGWRMFVAASAGFAQHDIAAKTAVREDPLAPYTQGGNDLEQTLRVWKRAGDAYVGIGAGAMYPISESFGIELELSASQAFPFAATLATGTLAVRMGTR